MRIGLFGGTFDPIHLAHLVLAEEARERLNLTYVLFMPTGDPWLKREKPKTAGEQRLRMVELAVASNPFFFVSDMEVRRAGPTYTVDTLEALRQNLNPSDEICFLLGMDSLLDLPRWHEPGHVLEMCTPVAFRRPGATEQRLEAVKSEFPLLGDKLKLMDAPLLEISSTGIRQRVAQGRSIRYLVPEQVEGFIRESGLYR